MIRFVKIRPYERGFLYRDRVFRRVLRPGRHLILDPLWRVRVEVTSVRAPWIDVSDLDVVVRSGMPAGEARVLDLNDRQRALVWIDGRFDRVLMPGLYALWTVYRDVRVTVLEVGDGRFVSDDLAAILATPSGARALETITVGAGQRAVLFVDGRPSGVLEPGRYAFWTGVANYDATVVDLREQVLDVSGQELMTADKVTLRLNAVVAYRIVDPVRAVTTVGTYEQALYREAQLALRAVVGGRDLDAFLSSREEIASGIAAIVRGRAAGFGVEVGSTGIRDVILPGDMKEILNRVTEARKAAEADLITRREETAAMRSQANTARIFESNPALMRLRELEVLEKVAGQANLNVVLGERGLVDRIVKLL